jgi:hypothetical protein
MSVPSVISVIHGRFGATRVALASRAVVCLAPALGLVARPARSQERVRMKAMRVEVGYSANHEGRDTGIGGGSDSS